MLFRSKIVAACRSGKRQSTIAARYGISVGRVSAIKLKAEKEMRRWAHKFYQFKLEECERTILSIKRDYDAMDGMERALHHSGMAEEIDMLLAHMRSAEMHKQILSTSR